MLTIAALLSPRNVREPVVRLLGAGPLAELMAAARIELARRRQAAIANATQSKRQP